MTPGSGCFAIAQTDRQTDGHGDSMTESDQRADSVKISSPQSMDQNMASYTKKSLKCMMKQDIKKM